MFFSLAKYCTILPAEQLYRATLIQIASMGRLMQMKYEQLAIFGAFLGYSSFNVQQTKRKYNTKCTSTNMFVT